jgi:PAS domain S-box-containing protein
MIFRIKIYILLILLIAYSFSANSQYHKSSWQPYDVNFEHITLEDGLSQSSVNVIFQDSYGFIWFGTQDGLNKYDGYSFTIYTPIFNDSTSISDNQIWAITEDKDKNLWIGTYGGLNKFIREKDIFQRFTYNKNKSNSIANNQIRALYIDNENLLWIGTKNGLDILNIASGIFTHYKSNILDTNSISENYIRGFCVDNYDRMWILTDNEGANIFNKEKNNFIRYNLLNAKDTRSILLDSSEQLWIGTKTNGLYKILFTDENNSIVHKIENYPLNNVLSIIEDNQGIMWLSSIDGLVRYDETINEFIKYTVDVNNPKSLNDNYIWTIFEDNTGIIWLGTFAGGICKYDKSKNKFTHYQINSKETDLIISNFIRSFTTDHEGNIWVGSKGGLFKFVFNEKLKIYEQVEFKTSNKLKDNYIREIVTDTLGNIWIATNSEGLAYLDLSKKVPDYTFYRNDPNANSLSSNNLRTIYIDKQQNLWIGTTDSGFDKAYYENGKIKFENFKQNDYNNLTDNYIRAIFQDSDSIYWIGTENGGLNKFDYKNKIFTDYQFISEKNSISSNSVTNIHEDSNGNLWLGTYGGGLNLFKKDEEKFHTFNKENGFTNNVIYGILEDSNKNLWISTNFGLVKFNINNFEYSVYKIWDGLQSNEFNTGAFYKTAKGEMIFGGINGFNIFYPENVKYNTYVPEIVLTDFKIFNKSISPKDSVHIIEKSITYLDKIELNYTQNIITIEFSALHFSNPENNQFKYKMEGIDDNWTIVKNKNYATYTHLPPGEYTFIVTSSNCDGIWSNKEKKLIIKITPPFSDTLLFKILIVVTLILIIVLVFITRTSRLKKQKLELEKQVLIRTKEIFEQKAKILEINEELGHRNNEISEKSELLAHRNSELLKLSLVASNTKNSIMIMNENAEIEWVNEGFTQLYGLTFDQLIEKFGKNMRNLSVKANIDELIIRCSKSNQVINYESYVNRKDIKKLWVQTTLSPVTDSNNKVIKIIAIESDISDLKFAEQEIILRNEEIRAQRESLIQQNEEINAHKEELEKINQILFNQNDSIMGSIRTALTIQNAILPKEEEIKKHFDCFILYQPKDIVSGDFYWYINFPVKGKLTEKSYFAVADCTGHGVPGAFMSMIGVRMLDEIVSEKLILEPSQILETLNKEIIKTLKQSNEDNNDGMDICLCYIENCNDDSKILTFSGARRNLIFYNSKNNAINILKGDRKSIGGTFSKIKLNFTDQKILLEKNDILYLTSDGYTDQIGSERHKFGSTQLNNILLQNSLLEMEQQKEILVKAIKNWQGSEIQRDDRTIFGLKNK